MNMNEPDEIRNQRKLFNKKFDQKQRKHDFVSLNRATSFCFCCILNDVCYEWIWM